MAKKKQLVIVGDQDFAQMAYEYFTHDSEYEVVAFSVEADYQKIDTLLGLPVVPFERLEEDYPPEHCEVYVAVVYGKLNRIREKLYLAAKEKGYTMASYISSRAFVWSNAKLGEHCFIFEDNTVQPFTQMGNNVILWSGNHVGHHSTIGDNVFVSSHVVISGWCTVGANSFLGVNTTIANNVNVGANSWIGHGSVLGHDVPEGALVKSANSDVSPLDEGRLFRALDRISEERA